MTNPPAMHSIPLPDGAIAWTRDGVHWYRLEPQPSGGLRMTRMDAPTSWMRRSATDTPQTDALVEEGGMRADAEVVRRIERERNAAIVEVARLTPMDRATNPATGFVYCPSCDYAIGWDQMMNTFDCPCPRCRGASTSQFYSVGSFAHIERRNAWIRGEIKGCPPPLPKETK